MSRGHPVIGPTRDGGFYLLGLCGRDDDLPFLLFDDVAWGGSGVYSAVMANGLAQGVEIRVLELLSDVDKYADLVALAGEMDGYRQFLTGGG